MPMSTPSTGWQIGHTIPEADEISTETMMKYLLTLLLLATANAQAPNYEEDYCCLCPNCGPRANPYTEVDSQGTICATLGSEMRDPQSIYQPGNDACKNAIKDHRDRCCDPNYSGPAIAQSNAEPEDPSDNYPQGTEPNCDVCIDGSFPKKPHTITAVLYLPGNPTCEDLYYMGRTGNIPSRLCYPLQDYMVDPCGCPPTSPSSTVTVQSAPSPPAPSPAAVPQRKESPTEDRDAEKLPWGRCRGCVSRKLKGE